MSNPSEKEKVRRILRQQLRSVAATWLAGLLVLLPLALTLAVLGWVVGLLNDLLGPGSTLGSFFSLLGYPLARDSGLAYFVGTLILLAAIYLLGIAARAGWHHSAQRFASRAVRRIPLIGPMYGIAERFAGMLGPKEDVDIGAMRPVWCFFGGHSTAVLALAPSGETLTIDGREYLAVLIPTAPVPIGGALLYVPAENVKPAQIGVDQLTAVYVSMGLASPKATEKRPQ
ncbi:MAG: DUF502 domain-containing protein [Betaproteobacteria bacterium]